jgi:hypothetical protein
MNERAAGVSKKSHAGDNRGIPPHKKTKGLGTWPRQRCHPERTIRHGRSASGNSPRALDIAEGHPRDSEQQNAMLNLILGRYR